MASRAEFYLGDRHPQVGLEPKDDWGDAIDWNASIQDQIEEMLEAIDTKREDDAMRDTRLARETQDKYMEDYKRHTTPSGVEQLADVEFAVDVLGGDPDPLLRLGFDPSVARAVNEGPLGTLGTYHGSDAPWYEAIWGEDVPESITRNVDFLNPMGRNLSHEEQAEVLRHEYRHRAYNELRNSRNRWKFDEQLRNIMGEQISREGESDVLPNVLEENLNRAFDQKYAKTFIKRDVPLGYEYPDNLGWGVREHYPREEQTFIDLMNRLESEADDLLSIRPSDWGYR